jgi:hypothetical protein
MSYLRNVFDLDQGSNNIIDDISSLSLWEKRGNTHMTTSIYINEEVTVSVLGGLRLNGAKSPLSSPPQNDTLNTIHFSRAVAGRSGPALGCVQSEKPESVRGQQCEKQPLAFPC